jgi:hypothetical protein
LITVPDFSIRPCSVALPRSPELQVTLVGHPRVGRPGSIAQAVRDAGIARGESYGTMRSAMLMRTLMGGPVYGVLHAISINGIGLVGSALEALANYRFMLRSRRTKHTARSQGDEETAIWPRLYRKYSPPPRQIPSPW